MSNPKTDPKTVPNAVAATPAKRTAGADFLLQTASEKALAKKVAHAFACALVVDDDPLGLKRSSAIAKMALPSQTRIVTAKTLGGTLDQLIADPTIDVIFLNDYLRPGDNALTTIPIIRRLFPGPIIVNSCSMTAMRGMALRRAGAAATVHLDFLDTRAMVEVLTIAAAWKSEP